jgi:hypothetical protein
VRAEILNSNWDPFHKITGQYISKLSSEKQRKLRNCPRLKESKVS